MKKVLLVFLLSPVLLGSFNLMAQSSWVTGGNSLTAAGSFGTNTNFSVIFETNNTERGRLTNTGLWGLGTISPLGKLHVNSLTGAVPFRASVNGVTKLLVNSTGGVSIGSGTTPPANGLFVTGNTGLGTATPLGKLHVNSLAGTVPFLAAVNGVTKLLVHSAGGVSIGSSTTPPANGLFVTGNTGLGTATPLGKLHVNSLTGTVPFLAAVNGVTKLLVHSGGGVSVGSSTTPPANGLFVSGNTGIGTSAPENTLHVFKGSAGTVTGYANAPLIVENSTSCYINILAPDATETGILFGKPADAIGGGIVYSTPATLNGLQFRTNGNISRMVLTDIGNLGVGTVTPGRYKTKISHSDFGFGIENASSLDVWEWHVGDAIDNGTLQLFFNSNFRGAFNPQSGGYFAVSDERLKTNIKPMSTMLDKINQLKPSTYQFKNTTDKQEYNGFIAQDVIKIFPSLVNHHVIPERKVDVYTMDYSGFGVLAIKGIQQLQPIIEEQKERMDSIENADNLKIATLEERISKLEASLAAITSNKNGSITNTSLEQNKPNPFNKSTIIRYSIPQGSKGQINIYDQTGKLVKALNANESGQSELGGYNLTSGTYTYTLAVNGKVALSKQMLIIK